MLHEFECNNFLLPGIFLLLNTKQYATKHAAALLISEAIYAFFRGKISVFVNFEIH